MPAEIGFRPVTPADRALLADWIARPHWARWWGAAEAEAAEIASGATPDFGPYVFTLDGRDAGYIQWWRPDGSWEIPVEAPPATTRGIDLSIADPGDCNRGLGSRALAAFVARLAADGVTRFLIDPAPDNAAARRAYARAGFVEVARGTHMDGPYVLMLLDLQPAEAE
jgi:RimJ/RimL family protein N-acetyltransferase